MSRTKHDPLVQLLHDLGLLERIPAPTTLRSRPEQPIRALAYLGLVDERKAIKKVAKHLSIPYVDLDKPKVLDRLELEEFVEIIDAVKCWKAKVIPLWNEPYGVKIAAANPMDREALKSLEFSLGKPINTVISPENQIALLLSENFSIANIDYDTLVDVENERVEYLGALPRDENLDIEDAKSPPIIRLCNKILADAVDSDASDIHIEPGQNTVEVRFRIDGVMSIVMELPKRLQPYVTSRLKLTAGMDISERRRPQDGRLRVKINDKPIDMRVSSVPASYGEKIVMRVLNTNVRELTFHGLGFEESLQEKLFDVLNKQGKMLLVTGPTGSGKTTTLYSALNYLRDGSSNIETVEDPIEYRISGINQIQVNEPAGVTFASALRSVLRQDPDIIMIGEIRDAETATIALQAAQTGHLVLSTLHTNDAPSVITRLYHLGADPFVLSTSLGGILAQRLVRKVCETCKAPLPESRQSELSRYIESFNLDRESLFYGEGCDDCRFSGYRGRLGVFSFLAIHDRIADAIAGQEPISSVVQLARQDGFRTLSEHSLELVQSGITSLAEVRGYLDHSSAQEAEKKDSISIPVPAAKSEVATEERAPLESAVPAGIQKQKILLIEDDEDVRAILSLLLQKEMFEVIEAENGLKGLEKVYESNPTIVLVDLMMPVMDGREFIKRMQNNADTRSIPIVVLTAVDDEQNEIDLLDQGATDFVSKASSSDILLTRLRRILKSYS